MEVQNSMELLAFGDLTAKFDDELHELLHARESEALLSFFERVSFSLRHEVAQQPSDMQEWFPRFTTLLDLESKRGKALGAPVLQFCLMTACQVAKFIRYAEGRRFPSGQDTYLLGVCAGSFAACAISVSQTVHEVVLAGVEATRIAFRTALCSFVQGKTMTTGGNGPWSAVVARDGGVEKLVQDYCQDQHSHSRLSAPYISAVAPNNITVSGAPEVLDDFVTSNGLKHHWLGIESPFHARHVFDEEHVDWVMAQFPEVEVWLRKPMMAIFSGSRGKKMMAADFCGLLRWAVSDVLRQVVEWKDIIGTISASLSAQQAAVCTITPFFCNAAPLLLSQLAQESKGLKTMQSAGLPASQGAARPTGRFADSKIAIVGYSGRFPEAGSAEELWQVLEGGRDVHREIPEDRFKWQRYYSATGKQRNTSKVKHGCFIEEPGLFDTRFFNMSPREADNTDPAHRLALMATYEAMEMAGMVPNRTPSTQQERVGVFFGVTSDDWREANSSQDIDTYFIPGGVRAFMPGRISYFFRFSGPSLCIDTACSSSFAAVQAACGYLLRGECDTAVAGGTNILTNPDIFTGLDRGHFLAGTGNCKTFDDSASGYCRGEAVGAVILKRLEDAVADGDPIAGVIGGAHTNHCGQSESITRPHEGDQVAVFERVLRYGDVDGGEISYVEMHGTGTQAGDATEMGSVLRVFAGEGKRKQMLHVGSAKANVGHSESASGVVSLIKVLLMMKKSQIPPHCGITTRLNRSYPADLAQRKVAIAARTTEWRREDSAGEKRRAFINNFSAAGGNTALLLEDGPAEQQTDAQAARSVYTVAISAKSATALAANVAGLAAFVEARPDTPLDALAYTTTARRLHHSHRLAFSGDSTAAIAAQLRDAPAGLGPRGRAPRIAYLFSGQGALYTQLGRELYERVPRFRDDVVRFNRMAQQLGFAAFVPLIDGTASRLDDAPLCAHHLALLCVQMALSQLWASWRVRPSVVVGHSLGEYAALHAAGVVSASDAIFLVGRRATLLEQHCTRGSHAMLAVKAPAEAVRPLLAQTACEVACINQPAETVVGGGRQAIDEVARRARQLGHEAVVLAMPFAFHTSQVDAMLPDFEAAACSVHFEAPQVPLLSPLLARAVGREPVFDASYLARACRGTVHLSAALEHARACAMVDGDTLWLEMGSHALCSPMVKATLGPDTLALASLHKATPPERTMASALEALYVRGVDIDWDSHARAHGGPCQVLQLPAYHWDLSRHWIDYRNDFLLTKGRCESAALPSLSPSVQRVLEHKPAPDTATMLVESDIFDPRLAPVLQGHLVNGAALCPSSLYADIALTVAKAMVQDDNNNNNNNNNKPAGLDVCNIKIDRPLIAAKGHTSHLIRASATAHWASGFITMSIYSVDSDGKPTVSHASLKVGLVANAALWLDEWKPMAYLIHARIAALEAAVAHGNCHKMKRSMVYKLFGSIVDYSPEYQGMQHVILDSDELEATAQVSFRVGPEGFVMNPRWIDSLGHLAGFIMNGNEKLPSHKHVFVNHGWDRLRFGEEPVEGKLYTTYNKMQRVHASLYAGDTYVLDGQRIVAVFSKVAFQQVPRSVLDGLLPARAPPPAIKSPPTACPEPVEHDATYGRVLKIIADEVRIDLSRLQPDCLFADLGLDSLLSLTVTSRINDEMGTSLPPSLFARYPSVKDLRALLDAPLTDMPPDTPELLSGSHSVTEESRASTSAASDDESLSFVVRQAIATQTGMPAQELMPDALLAQLGVDSLLSLSIADSVTQALGAEVSSKHFLDHETLGDMEAALGKALGLVAAAGADTVTKDALVTGEAIIAPGADTATPDADTTVTPDADLLSAPPHATSILLHRPAAPAHASRANLFLLPDGSGSAASYAALAKLDAALTVYGINCPWRTAPLDMSQLGVTTRQVVAKFVAEMRRLQPHGPYLLGGWSAGGIFAYEAVRHLMAAGQRVDQLLLIDAPNPVGLENPPPRMFDFFQRSGVFANMGSGKTVPPWLRHHFESVVDMLDSYKPQPLPSPPPPTLVVYARDGVCKDPSAPQMETSPDDAREMLWLLHNRTDFSASGWASLLGPDSLTVCVLDHVNHFTMMNDGPHMDTMRHHARRAIMAAGS